MNIRKKLKGLLAAAAVGMMSFTTLAGTVTWQLSPGHAFKGDGQACMYQTYAYDDYNTDYDGDSINLDVVVAAFADGTLELSNPPRRSANRGVTGPVAVVNGVFTAQSFTLGKQRYNSYALVALVTVNGREMLYVSNKNEQTADGEPKTTVMSFELGDAEYDAKEGFKGKGYYYVSPPQPVKPIADLAKLAEIFADVPEVTANITTDSELEAFNGFLSSVGVTSAANLSAAQKAYAYPSFALRDILVTPTLFETRPELKIDAFAPKATAGDWTLTVSLRAGEADTAMVAAKLKEKIKVGTTADDITKEPTVTEVPAAAAGTLTFALNPGNASAYFVRIVVLGEGKVDAGGVQLWKDGPFWAETNLGDSEVQDHPDYGALYTFDNADAAVKKLLGQEWRVPTKDEFAKLVDSSYCTRTWDAERKGWTFTGATEGYEDKSIFLPIAGYDAVGGRGHAGEYGYYWSSDVRDDERAYNLAVHGAYARTDYTYRFYGTSVRAVR